MIKFVEMAPQLVPAANESMLACKVELTKGIAQKETTSTLAASNNLHFNKRFIA